MFAQGDEFNLMHCMWNILYNVILQAMAGHRRQAITLHYPNIIFPDDGLITVIISISVTSSSVTLGFIM